VSKSSAKPGSSCVVSVSGFSEIAFAAVRTHFPKRVNARLMPSAMAYAANSGTSPSRFPRRSRCSARTSRPMLRPIHSVRIERDVVRMTHRALSGEVVDLVHPSPRQDAAPFRLHDEVAAFPDEIVVEGGSVAPSVVYDRALASVAASCTRTPCGSPSGRR
jgi:hypothetical protein